ncbi:MAG: SpoVA/SpoVAEb family sporulation membrane protein, partial [Enterocloster aldenensis]
MEVDKKKYEEYVKEITPVHSLPKSMACAFLVGGVICLIGQLITNYLMKGMG